MKTDEQVTKEKIDAFCRIALLVSVSDTRDLVEEINRMESLMPIVDPSGWKDISKNVGGHKDIAAAFLTFRIALEEELEKGDQK